MTTGTEAVATPMTREELLEELENLRAVGIPVRVFGGRQIRDKEQEHILADELILAYLNDPEITAAFEAIEKWYA